MQKIFKTTVHLRSWQLRVAHPQIRVLEVRTVVLDDIFAIALLHDTDLLDDLLQFTFVEQLKQGSLKGGAFFTSKFLLLTSVLPIFPQMFP